MDISKLVDAVEKLDECESFKVGNHQIFKDGGLYVVEKYEYTSINNVDIFSVYDSYKTGYEALSVAVELL